MHFSGNAPKLAYFMARLGLYQSHDCSDLISFAGFTIRIGSLENA